MNKKIEILKELSNSLEKLSTLDIYVKSEKGEKGDKGEKGYTAGIKNYEKKLDIFNESDIIEYFEYGVLNKISTTALILYGFNEDIKNKITIYSDKIIIFSDFDGAFIDQNFLDEKFYTLTFGDAQFEMGLAKGYKYALSIKSPQIKNETLYKESKVVGNSFNDWTLEIGLAHRPENL